MVVRIHTQVRAAGGAVGGDELRRDAAVPGRLGQPGASGESGCLWACSQPEAREWALNMTHQKWRPFLLIFTAVMKWKWSL